MVNDRSDRDDPPVHLPLHLVMVGLVDACAEIARDIVPPWRLEIQQLFDVSQFDGADTHSREYRDH
jgi:hypothetical protein